MKRIFAVLLVIGISLLSLSAYAGQGGALYSGNKDTELLVETILNTAASSIVTNVATTTIIPGKHRIIGVSAVSTAAGAIAIGLWDTANSTGTLPNGRGEWSAPTTNMVDEVFPYPLSIDTQLTVSQSNATVVNVWYERVQP